MIKKYNQFVNENETYDELSSLRMWYEEETKKLDNVKDFKTWKLKSKLLQKHYFNKQNEITKKENPYGLSGNMKSNFIYHYTNGDSLINIIEDNELIGGGDECGGISFTSHPNLYKRGFIFWYPNEYTPGKHHLNVGVKIKFDFNQMKEDGLKFKKGSEHIGTHSGEDEIRLLKDELENPIKYIKEIIIFKDKENNYEIISKLLDIKNIKYKII
jgi:hypothetical protein